MSSLDAVAGEIPADTLPDGLEGLVYCPGTINLRPFRQLKEEDFIEDFRKGSGYPRDSSTRNSRSWQC